MVWPVLAAEEGHEEGEDEARADDGEPHRVESIVLGPVHNILCLLEDPVLGSVSHLAIWASPWMELVQRKSSIEFIIEGVFWKYYSSISRLCL